MSSVADKLSSRTAAPVSKQVRLHLGQFSIWSVVKVCLVLGLVAAFLSGLVLCIFWLILTGLRVPQQVESLLGLSTASGTSTGSALGTSAMLGVAVIMGALNFFAVMALGIVSALLYKFYSRLTGGLHMGFTNQ